MISDFDIATNAEAERTVLACCFRQPEILGWLDLDDSHFADLRYRHIWQAARRIHAERQTADELLVRDRLHTQGKLDAIGGDAFLADLAELTSQLESTHHVEHYAHILRQKRITRETLLLGGEIAAEHRRGVEGDELLDSLLAKAAHIERLPDEEDTSLVSAIREQKRRALLSRTDRITDFVATGIKALDATIGGIPLGKPSALGARPGAGKSTFLLTLATNIARREEGVAIFTYEDRREAFAQRLMAAQARVSLDRATQYELDVAEQVRWQGVPESWPKFLTVDHAHGCRVETICRRALIAKRRTGLRLMAIDYIQNMPSPQRGFKKHEAIEENMLRLMEFSAQQNIALLVLSQIKQEVEREDRRPRLSDYRHSDAIGIIAKLCLFLHDAGDGRLEVLIAKNSQGPAGKVTRLSYDRALCEIN